jgi:hypothetical protein
MRASQVLALLSAVGIAILISLPSPAADPDTATEVRNLIDKLGSGSFSEREEATAALDLVGEPALAGLRVAAESDDAEVRRRAGELVRKIEQRVDTAQLLASTKVTLAYKDTPLSQAVADLSKQSGWNVQLQDSRSKAAARKITLKTNAISFWQALDQLCAKAHVVEEALLPATVAMAAGAPQQAMPGGGAPPPVVLSGSRSFSGRPMPVLGQLTLVDSEQAAMPVFYADAVRVRALQTPQVDRGDASHVHLNLIVTTEPKVRCQEIFSLRLDKVLDEHGQALTVADDLAPEPLGYVRRSAMPYSGGFSIQYLHTRLNAGENPTKSLREVRGTLSTRLYTEPRPVIVVDDVLKAAGTTSGGKEGGAIKVVQAAKDERGHVALKFELEPPNDSNPAATVAGLPARPRVPVRAGPALPPPGGGVALPAVVPGQPTTRIPLKVGGLSLIDDKGNVVQPAAMTMNFRRDVRGLIREYSMEFDLPKGRDASKLIFAAGKSVNVEVPFVLKDIPLP